MGNRITGNSIQNDIIQNKVVRDVPPIVRTIFNNLDNDVMMNLIKSLCEIQSNK